jgi:hypothetical protein
MARLLTGSTSQWSSKLYSTYHWLQANISATVRLRNSESWKWSYTVLKNTTRAAVVATKVSSIQASLSPRPVLVSWWTTNGERNRSANGLSTPANVCCDMARYRSASSCAVAGAPGQKLAYDSTLMTSSTR